MARDGGALGIRAEAARLGLRLALLLPPEREAWWKALRGEGPVDDGTVALLPPEAALLLRWSGDPAEAARRLEPWYPPEVKKAFATHQLDPVTGLAPAFGPAGAALAWRSPPPSRSPTSPPLASTCGGSTPSRSVHLDAVLPVRNVAALRAFLARLQKAGPRLSLKVVPRGPAAEPTGWTLSWGKAAARPRALPGPAPRLRRGAAPGGAGGADRRGPGYDGARSGGPQRALHRTGRRRSSTSTHLARSHRGAPRRGLRHRAQRAW